LSKVIKAKYKKGVFEPLEPIELPEDEVVEVTVSEPSEADREAFFRSAGGWKDLVPEEFVAEIHKRRETRRRPLKL